MNDFVSGIPPLQSSDERVTIGRFTYGKPEFKLWAVSDRIEIGAFCSISSSVIILGGGEHNPDWITTYPLRIALGDHLAWKDGHPIPALRPTRIGNDVWIGHGATVLGELSVGDGAIIGAGAVVTRDVAPYAVVAGNPARIVRFRFSPMQIESLLRIRWWDWPIKRIMDCVADLSCPDIDGFIALAHAHSQAEHGHRAQGESGIFQ